jgi:hypothetical protein
VVSGNSMMFQVKIGMFVSCVLVFYLLIGCQNIGLQDRVTS